MAKVFYDKQYMEANQGTSKGVNLKGLISGKLTVLDKSTSDGKWWCVCECSPDRFFEVAGSSLKRYVTKSCGCNYKNNGGRVAQSQEQFSSSLVGFSLISQYTGFNYPVTIVCEDCGLQHSVKRAIYAQAVRCPCKINKEKKQVKEQYWKKLTEKEPYSFVSLDKEGAILSCDNCGMHTHYRKYEKIPCPCLLGVEDACSVYILTSPTKDYVKIGKAVNPYMRVKSINMSGAEDFVISHLEWVSGEACAFLLESYLHRLYGGRNYIDRAGFSGDTETFSVSLKQVQQDLMQIEDSLKLLRKGIEPPELQKEKPLPEVSEWSFEFDGYWYPHNKKLWSYFGYAEPSLNTVETLKRFKTHEEMLGYTHMKLLPEDIPIPFVEFINKLREVGITYRTFHNRVNTGWTVEDAMNTPLLRIRKYFYDNELLTLKELCNKFGLSGSHSVYSSRFKHILNPIDRVVCALQTYGAKIERDDLAPYQTVYHCEKGLTVPPFIDTLHGVNFKVNSSCCLA